MPLPLVNRYSAIVIAGPTGVGKSAFAVEMAERFGGEIVGADAFQVYEGLDILTAKAPAEVRRAAPHHLIGVVPLTDCFDVAQYLVLAERCLADIRSRRKIPMIVGGTGLYIRSLLRGLADLPEANGVLRAELESQPLSHLQERLRTLDPEAASSIDLKNPRRVIRALEVCLLTGRAFSTFRSEWNAQITEPCGIVLTRERKELCQRIDARAIEMFDSGVEREVRAVGTAIGATARQTLGWREIRSLLDGEITRGSCIAEIQSATRKYAKRQMTWFRRESGLQAVEASRAAQAVGALIRARSAIRSSSLPIVEPP